MATNMSQIPQMDWSSADLAESLILFKQKMVLFLEDEKITGDEAISRKICRGIGDEGLRRLNASDLTDEQKKKPNSLWSFFENQLKVEVHFRIHRLHLMQYRQKTDETLDDFITRARTLAHKCQFSEEELSERLIELIIASTPYEGFRKELLGKDKGYPLQNVLKEGRKYEAISAGNDQLHKLDQKQTQINEVSRGRKCSNCGTSHKPRQCPAYYDTCHACGKKGHWKSCCRLMRKKRITRDHSQKHHNKGHPSNRGRSSHGRKSHSRYTGQRSKSPSDDKLVDTVNTDYESDGETYTKSFYSLTVSNKCLDSVSQRHIPGREEAYTTLNIQPPGLPYDNYTLRLKIDTGASGNTLPLRTLRQIYGRKTNPRDILEAKQQVRLTAYNGQEITCLGSLDMVCQNKCSSWELTKFYVVDVPGPAVVGLPTCEKLKLVTINVDHVSHKQGGPPATHKPAKSILKNDNMKACTKTISKPINNVQDLLETYPDQFDRIGNFAGEAKITLKDDATPFVNPPRKCPIHIRDELKLELDKLVTQGIIKKVNEHTDWCSSLAFSTKKDGSLRICLDPQRLNDNIKRCPYKIPTVDEINPQFAGARLFSKLDAKAGYWAIHLDSESQLLTTFRTPFGRYCWLRLPFGLNISQDIFQDRMDQILEGLNGVVSIADDIVVFGVSKEDHDRNLVNLMNRAAEKGLVFNSTKCHINQSSVTFFGNIYTAEGIRPDPDKVRDIQQMPSPQNKEDAQRFLGMLTYLTQFIPQLADKAHTLRSLLKKDTPWTWDTVYQENFETLKKAISENACLKYYDRNDTVDLEVDASPKGLGCALVQQGKPVAFGSKTLTECQSRYSNIEREMLAVVYGIQRYHTFLYARPFTIITDHKPLVSICTKPIHAAPPRLQNMLLLIQGYRYKIKYRPGEDMVLADTLSRIPNPNNNTEIDLDLRVDGINVLIDGPKYKVIALINFPPYKQELLREETTKDTVLNHLKEIVHSGWPEAMKSLPEDLRPYWSFREEIALEAGVLFKGRQILIPKTMQKDIMEQLHQGHREWRRPESSLVIQSIG